ncbi:hypothetical protein DSO57_1025821 [Entomophthora muscae]|uniref:Uncharacterized protein n=1 Tax=Entomophthora muscae TaxID=34485 RepID=A0ACC2UBA7_9FUNG|nr:hypothetical protein DSO57_1025821 [Entomophthora muscae]
MLPPGPQEFAKVFPYLLLALYHFQFDLPGSIPASHQAQENADQPPELFRPPGAPYSPVHFTEYPPKPDHLEFTLEKILIYNPEAQIRETEFIGCEGTWITKQPLLFCDKYNYLPAYLVPMTLPLIPRPNSPQESIATSDSTSTQIFGVMYITLTGLIDSIVPSSRPWDILGNLLSYIVKLAPILWWSLSSGPGGSCPQSCIVKETAEANNLQDLASGVIFSL